MNTKNWKIVLLPENEIVNTWQFSTNFAYQIICNFDFEINTVDELLIQIAEKNEVLSSGEFSPEQNLRTNQKIYYGIDGFFKKNNVVYYDCSEKKICINLTGLTLECLVASCINYVLSDKLEKKNLTVSFLNDIFKFLTKPKFHQITLNMLEKYDVFTLYPVKLIDSSIFYFNYAFVRNSHKQIYINILQFLQVPLQDSFKLVDSCLEQSTFTSILNYLKNYYLQNYKEQV